MTIGGFLRLKKPVGQVEVQDVVQGKFCVSDKTDLVGGHIRGTVLRTLLSGDSPRSCSGLGLSDSEHIWIVCCGISVRAEILLPQI